MILARGVRWLDFTPGHIADSGYIAEIREALSRGEALMIRNVVAVDAIADWITYLSKVGGSSLPNYRAIGPRCPNFHRIHAPTQARPSRGCFHQFSFFPCIVVHENLYHSSHIFFVLSFKFQRFINSWR